MNLPFFIAKRYLISKKSHNAINIITGISIGAVCIVTAALVIVLSGLNGLTELVESLYNSFHPDIRIMAKRGKTFEPDAPVLNGIKKRKDVVYFTEVIEENALLKYNEQQSLATIKGVSDDFVKMSRFDTLIAEGHFMLHRDERNYAVIGSGISHRLNVGPTSFNSLAVYAPRRGINASVNPAEAFNRENLYVSGIFAINDDFDSRFVLVPIRLARQLLDYETEVTAIEIGLALGTDMQKAQGEIKRLAGDAYVVKNRYEQNELLFKTLESEKLWTFIILIFILIIATFNIIGSLTMLIIEKQKDVSILWNMGADSRLIRKIFLAEGLLITLIGALLGLALGSIMCWLQLKYELLTFGEAGAGYVIDAYPVAMKGMDFILILVSVMLIGLFAAWYPVKVFTERHLFRSKVGTV